MFFTLGNEPAVIGGFGQGKATKIKPSCDDDSTSNTLEFCGFEKSGYKPLYISVKSSWDAGGAGGVDFEVTYTLEDFLNIYTNRCKVLK